MNFPIHLVGKRRSGSVRTLIEDNFGPNSSLITGNFFRARTRYAISPLENTRWVKGSAQWEMVSAPPVDGSGSGQLLDSGSLQNLSAVNGYQGEAGVGIVIDTTSITETGLNDLNLSLAYTLGDAAESLYLHLWGVVKTGDPLVEEGGDLQANDIVAHLGYRQDGLLQDYSFQNDAGLPDVLEIYNLFTGVSDVGNPKMIPDHGLTFTGSTSAQEHTSVISLAGHSLNSIDAYDYVFIGFSRDVAGSSSAVVIDSVNLTLT